MGSALSQEFPRANMYLLRLGQLLDGAVHPFLEDSNLLILFVPESLQICTSVVKLAQEIIDVSMMLSDALNELVEVLNETTDLGERSTLDMRL